jgi:hypothetical protein
MTFLSMRKIDQNVKITDMSESSLIRIYQKHRKSLFFQCALDKTHSSLEIEIYYDVPHAHNRTITDYVDLVLDEEKNMFMAEYDINAKSSLRYSPPSITVNINHIINGNRYSIASYDMGKMNTDGTFYEITSGEYNPDMVYRDGVFAWKPTDDEIKEYIKKGAIDKKILKEIVFGILVFVICYGTIFALILLNK